MQFVINDVEKQERPQIVQLNEIALMCSKVAQDRIAAQIVGLDGHLQTISRPELVRDVISGKGLVNIALWMRELDVDGGYREANVGF